MPDVDPTPAALRAARAALLAADLDPQPMREQLVSLHDGWLTGVLGEAPDGVSLVAVGGYGRAELLPGSDLDLVLVHDGSHDDAVVAELADRVWYPVWDSGVSLDHAVRTVDGAVAQADSDLKVVLGLLDLRLVAGDPAPAEALRSRVRERWRAKAATRLPELAELNRERAAEFGELAFLLEPDLRSARGGLRDVLSLRAMALAQVCDSPGQDVQAAGRLLLDTRTVLHSRTAGRGRAADVLVLQEQDAVAQRLGREDADALMHEVAAAGRLVAHRVDTTWRRVRQAVVPTGRRRFGLGIRPRPPVARTLALGVVERDGEVAFAPSADPTDDPTLVLVAAAAAAAEGLPLSQSTLDRMAQAAPLLPVPWPDGAREALVTLLGAGPDLVGVWESLDFAGVVTALLPEWEHTRSRPQRNAFHRFTVDRHLLEAAVVAGSLTRDVERPDLLLLGALLHDIGKGLPGDHTVVGMDLVQRIAPRLGLAAEDVAVLVAMVEHHLLLADTAARRDPDDPATAQTVAAAVGDAGTLRLLHALTVADSQATGPSMWSAWKAGQLASLVARTEGVLQGRPPLPPAPFTDDELALLARPGLVVDRTPGEGVEVLKIAQDDGPGLLAGLAGVLAVHRLDVRRLTASSDGSRGLTVADVRYPYGPPDWTLLTDDLRRMFEGRLDLTDRLARREADAPRMRAEALVAPPRVRVLGGEVSALATVIEVRARSRPGLLHDVATAIVDAGLFVRSAMVSTLGAEAVDTFYVTGHDGGPLTDEETRRALRDEVLAAVTG